MEDLCGVPFPLVCGIPASVDPFGVGALEFQRLHYDGSCQGSSQSKGKSSDKGQTFEESEKSDYHPLVGALVRVDPSAGCLLHCGRGKLTFYKASTKGRRVGELWSWPLWVSRARLSRDSAKLFPVDG